MNAIRSRGASAATLVTLVVVALAAALAGYWFGARTPKAQDATTGPPAAPAAGAALTDASGRRVLYWHDPMAPGQRFDKPGKSPFMDMDLVPVYADAAADSGAVSVSPRLAQSLGVRTVEAKSGTLDSGFRTTGAVAVDERTLTGVQSRVQGFVERLHVRATYDPVRAGQPIADLFVPEWVAAQEELLALRASRQRGGDALVDAARGRLRLLGMPEAEIERVEREGRSSGRVTVTAPMAGIVWEIGARDGMAVMPGTNLVRIAGLATVWVIAEIPEAQAGLVAAGTKVEVRSAAAPERALAGTVQTLLPEVNAATRTVRARIELANAGGALKPGMFVTVGFRGKAVSGVLVPSEAVIRTGTRDVVIVASGEGRYTPVEVKVGRESGDLSEIVAGIDAGTRVVASGQFLIDSEASLRGVLARMNAGGAPPSAEGRTLPETQAGAAPVDPHAAHRAPAPAPAGAGSVVHRASGVVRDVDGGDVFIQHGAIPSAGMGAMTMGFKAPATGVPAGVKPGTRVDFAFTITPEGELALSAIAPAAAGGKP
ncbi:MAG TPA: efflux RND transporter periplasmic adaptor subunit [Casimicrobiaceae bacterium]|nr:efflux RND transporter periplasmic adaptor subunit [Casimicrobiaceae bacterium]